MRALSPLSAHPKISWDSLGHRWVIASLYTTAHGAADFVPVRAAILRAGLVAVRESLPDMAYRS